MFFSRQSFLLFFIAFLLLATYERVISTFFQRKAKSTQAIYYKWLYTTLFFSYIALIIFCIWEYFLRDDRINLLVSLSGFLLYFLGMSLRRSAIRDLGGNWSNFTEIKNGHELVTRGIYSYLRHPYYLAVIFELVGVSLIANSYAILTLVFLIQVPLLWIRAKLEDGILDKHFGEAYKRYKNKEA